MQFVRRGQLAGWLPTPLGGGPDQLAALARVTGRGRGAGILCRFRERLRFIPVEPWRDPERDATAHTASLARDAAAPTGVALPRFPKGAATRSCVTPAVRWRREP